MLIGLYSLMLFIKNFFLTILAGGIVIALAVTITYCLHRLDRQVERGPQFFSMKKNASQLELRLKNNLDLIECAPAQELGIKVILINNSDFNIISWRSGDGVRTGVNIGSRLVSRSRSGLVIEVPRAFLTGSLLPRSFPLHNRQEELIVTVDCPEKLGFYRLDIDPVQELVAWRHDVLGSVAISVDLAVIEETSAKNGGRLLY